MNQSREAILTRTRKMIVPGAILDGLLLIALWILFAVTDDQSKTLGITRTSWLALACVATLAGPPLMYFAIRERLFLLRHGREVKGKVSAISMLSKSGTRPMTYSYTVDGKQFSIKRDTASHFVSQMSVGSAVVMLVHPQKPKKAMLLNHGPDRGA